ncbi:hypothetical protein PBS_05170 [Paraburkholderia sp. 2C]
MRRAVFADVPKQRTKPVKKTFVQSNGGAKDAGAKTASRPRSKKWQSRWLFPGLKSDSGGRNEHLFLPKALAVLDPLPAAPLVGSEKAANASRED